MMEAAWQRSLARDAVPIVGVPPHPHYASPLVHLRGSAPAPQHTRAPAARRADVRGHCPITPYPSYPLSVRGRGGIERSVLWGDPPISPRRGWSPRTPTTAARRGRAIIVPEPRGARASAARRAGLRRRELCRGARAPAARRAGGMGVSPINPLFSSPSSPPGAGKRVGVMGPPRLISHVHPDLARWAIIPRTVHHRQL